jgi:phosphate transport system permease protein
MATGRSTLPATPDVAGTNIGARHTGVDGNPRPDFAGLATGHPPAPPGPPQPDGGENAERLPRRRRLGGDSVFRGFTTLAGALVLLVITAIGVFLVVKAIPAFREDQANFFTYEKWFPNDVTNPRFGIAALAVGTLISSILALLLAVPVALGIALCLSQYAPRWVATPLGFVVDLLAAVPSIVYGLWGRDYFVGPVRDLSGWLHRYFGWIPLFGSDGPYGKSLLLGGIVLAIMVLPIVTAISREVFAQAPHDHKEAALALGATRWEMIRTAVLPYGRPGVIAATILGLGRALGETIALALVLGNTFAISFDLIENGGNSIAANIANQFGEANDLGRSALIASGLILFAITLVVNVTARAIIYRRREFSGTAG